MKRVLFAVAALLLLALPGAARADSIVFTKDHNVWLAKPDGTGLYQVTGDGTEVRPYLSPAQADDGTIVVGHGTEIVRLRQNGEVLSHFDPPAATDSVGATIDEVPQEIAVSPDGSRIAFAYYRSSCPPAAPCGARQVVLYSYADRLTPVSVFGQQLNKRNPAWVDGDRILLFGGAGSQVNLDSPGGGNDDAAHWFDDGEMEDLDDGELSRQGDRLALLRSYGSNLHLAIFHVDSVGGGIEPACFSGADAQLASPTWSPDGRSLAFVDSEGIEVLPLPSVVAGDCPGASSSHVVVAGGAEPDWGPADVNPGPRPCADCGSGKPGKGRLALKPSKTAKLGAALKHGVVVKVAVPGPGKITAVARLKGKKVAAGAATAKAAGTVAVRLRFTAKAAKSLRGRAALRLTTKVAFRPSGGGKATTASGALRLAGWPRGDRTRRTGTVRRVRIATWNVNSAKQRLPRLLPWLEERRPDVVCLQETKLSDEAFRELFGEELAARGYEAAVHGEPTWNGVAILSRVGLEDVVAGLAEAPGFPHPEARALAATCDGVRVFSVYVPNGREPDSDHYRYKLAWLAALRDALVAAPAETVVCGDMNIAPADEDVFDPAAYVGHTHVTAPERAALAELQALGLRDVVRDRWPSERVFTYWDYRAGMFHRDLGMRIDLVLATAPLATRVRAAWVDRLARKGKGPSDHAPVIVDLDEAPDGDIGPVVPPPSAPATGTGTAKLPQSP